MDEPPSTATTVTEFESTGQGNDWKLVLSDGREFRFSAEACRKFDIDLGMAVDEELLTALEQADRDVAIHDSALDLLSHRSRSAAEMRTRLTMRGFSDEAVEHEIDRLERAGLLDDAAFARAWVADRQHRSPRGQQLLRYELLGKGIEPEAVDTATEDVDDHEVALALARQKARKMGPLDRATFMRKVGAHLHRKGIGYDVASAALSAVWSELEATREEQHDGHSASLHRR